jgi:hypothetical protein
VGGIGQHLERLDGILLERTVEDEESRESELALDIGSVEVIDL